MKVEFAPVNVPLRRRLQTLVVFLFVFVFLQGLSWLGLFLFVYLLLFTKYYWISLAYALWYYYDKDRCHKGGYFSMWFRRLSFWTYFKEFFPVELIKTADLDPNKNYLFATSPHGIMCFSAFANFGSDATGFSTKFPGLTPHLITLNVQFRSPLQREFLMLNGTCCAEERGLKYILENKGRCKDKGQVCVILTGGARESLESYPDKYRLILNKRKGFVRVAMQTGASLAPVILFGETNAYHTVQVPADSWIRRLQEKILQWLLIGTPIILGRGVFNYTIGMMPFRVPLYTVVGKPIDIEKIEKPTREQIEAVHSVYKQELVKLFDEYKQKYSQNPNVQLEIIE